MFWNQEDKKEKEVRKLLEIINECDIDDEYRKIVDTFVRVIKLQPKESKHWIDLLNFIYFNYQNNDPYDWDDLLLEAITLSQKARQYVSERASQSMFFLFEYKFIVELIKYNFSFSEDYSDDKLEELLNCSVELDPKNNLAIQERANYYQSNGDYEKAKIEFDKIIDEDENITLTYDIALNYRLMGDNINSIIMFEKLYTKADDSIIKKVALESLIEIYTQENNYERKKYYHNLLNKLQ